MPCPEGTRVDPSQVRVCSSVFRAYDVRGVVPVSLNDDVVEVLGIAIAILAHSRGVRVITVGRDGRNSSPALAMSLIRGLRRPGLDVVDVGMVPTPVLYFSTFHLQTGSGVMVTGSHNDPEYNGLKIVLDGVAVLGRELQQQIDRMPQNGFANGLQGSICRKDVEAAYLERVQRDIEVVPESLGKHIVVDAGNGVAGPLFIRLMQSLGHHVLPMNCQVDGDFPAHLPDPSQPEHLRDLVSRVQETQADVGFALDGDGDRLGLVDASGKIIWPDRQLMLLAQDILSRNPGSQVIYDVKCSRHLQAVIENASGVAIMHRTGHSLIKRKMMETGAVLAGEMSGHVFIKERWYGFDDALYVAARLMKIFCAATHPTDVLFSALPESLTTPELRMSLPENQHREFMQRIHAGLFLESARIVTVDGVRVETENAWGLIRPSNTSPFIVLRFEADTDAALQRIQRHFRKAILDVFPEAALPF